MLKGIPEVISPDLLKALAEMGHGDIIVIGDDFYPAVTMSEGKTVINADGIKGPELLEAVLTLMPVDADYVEHPIMLMDVEEAMKDKVETPAVWEQYMQVADKMEEKGRALVGFLDRFEFYEKAKKAYVTVSSGERQPYGNVIIQKGVQ